jgi:hypothetical protein
MTSKKVKLNNSFSIVVDPKCIEDVWTGEVELSIATQNGNTLNDEDYDALMNFCRLICASVPVMERRIDIREMLEGEAEKYMPQYTLNNKKNLEIVDKQGNVITLDFTTRTKGEA